MNFELMIACAMMGPLVIPFHPKIVDRVAATFERHISNEARSESLLNDPLTVERWKEQAEREVEQIGWGDNLTDRLMFVERLHRAIAVAVEVRNRLKEGRHA